MGRGQGVRGACEPRPWHGTAKGTSSHRKGKYCLPSPPPWENRGLVYLGFGLWGPAGEWRGRDSEPRPASPLMPQQPEVTNTPLWKTPQPQGYPRPSWKLGPSGQQPPVQSRGPGPQDTRARVSHSIGATGLPQRCVPWTLRPLPGPINQQGQPRHRNRVMASHGLGMGPSAVRGPSTSEGLGALCPASCPVWMSPRSAPRHTWMGDARCARCTQPCPARLE